MNNEQDTIIKETGEFKATNVNVDKQKFATVATEAWEACEKSDLKATHVLTMLVVVADGLTEVDPDNRICYKSFLFSAFKNAKFVAEAKIAREAGYVKAN